MEWANNGNLEEYLDAKCKSLQWPEKIKLAKGIAEGLKCLHNKQIFHRDLVSDHLCRKGFERFVFNSPLFFSILEIF